LPPLQRPPFHRLAARFRDHAGIALSAPWSRPPLSPSTALRASPVCSKAARRVRAFPELDFYYHSTNDDSVLQELAQVRLSDGQLRCVDW
jgi:hypothetical protein